MSLLQRTLGRIEPVALDPDGAVARRLDNKTKPPGSLGRLEELARRYVSIHRRARPIAEKAVFVFAGDHGVAAAGVSAYPQEVTAQMVLNFLAGGAAINVLARHVGARVVVADLGVAADLPAHENLVVRKVRRGTRNMLEGPAMTREEAVRALEAGIGIFEETGGATLDLCGTGDMGIGNTTASSAIVSVLARKDTAEVTGRGTGIDAGRHALKVQVVRRAIEVNRPDPADPLDVLAKVGGYEIGGLAGVCLAAAGRRVPVVLDGFISTAAAMIACALAPATRDYLIASHRSVEPGHAAMLEWLDLSPLFDLGLRLGEGTGAALAMPLVEAGVKILLEMASFDEAGVSREAPR